MSFFEAQWVLEKKLLGTPQVICAIRSVLLTVGICSCAGLDVDSFRGPGPRTRFLADK